MKTAWSERHSPCHSTYHGVDPTPTRKELLLCEASMTVVSVTAAHIAVAKKSSPSSVSVTVQ